MKATITVFTSETHMQYFEPREARYEFVHDDGWTYESALSNARKMIETMGATIESEYYEENEFGDPITCFFVE